MLRSSVRNVFGVQLYKNNECGHFRAFWVSSIQIGCSMRVVSAECMNMEYSFLEFLSLYPSLITSIDFLTFIPLWEWTWHHKCAFTMYASISTSEPLLLNLILLNLIVRWPSECSHYINNMWNATFGLWKIRIMNGWMVSFEWKTSKHHENRELVATLWFNFECFRR